jgi:hypothetical protein
MSNRQLKAARRELEQGRKRYGPRFEAIHYSEWPQGLPLEPEQIWRNNRFLVQVFNEPRGIVRLSVADYSVLKGFKNSLPDFNDQINWSDLQRIKDQLGWGKRTAIELFPPKDCVVYECNMRHLWLLPYHFDFMWGPDNGAKE